MTHDSLVCTNITDRNSDNTYHQIWQGGLNIYGTATLDDYHVNSAFTGKLQLSSIHHNTGGPSQFKYMPKGIYKFL